MDFTRAFTFFTEDERWPAKVGIGALVMLAATFLIFPAIFLTGYQLALMRNVVRGDSRPLPEWNEWGRLFSDGLYLFLALLVYSLPIWLLFCAGFGIFFLPLLAGGGNEEVIGALFGLAFAGWLLLACLILLGAFAMLFIMPALYVQYVRTGDFGALFRFGEIIAIVRTHAGDILLTAVAGIAGNLAISLVASPLVATGCGIILALPLSMAGTVWVLLALAHMYGQIARKIEGKSAVPA
jgi:hypothetical protein